MVYLAIGMLYISTISYPYLQTN